MLTITKGDVLKSEHEAIVIPVNCVGVMGAGLAKKFKEMYSESHPEIINAYINDCKSDTIVASAVSLHESTSLPHKYILFAATKQHWRDNGCELYIVRTCLSNIVRHILNYRIANIGIPALGCGCGKIEWDVFRECAVKDLACYSASELCDITLYEPI